MITLQVATLAIIPIVGVAAISSIPPPPGLFLAAQISPFALLGAWAVIVLRWRRRWAWAVALLLSGYLPLSIALLLLGATVLQALSGVGGAL